MKERIGFVCRLERWRFSREKLSLFAVFLAIGSVLSIAQNTPAHPTWPGPGQLFVGTCYQPIDRSPEQIDQDIAIMRHAGFNVVRMGDLSWDSFEPSQGKFDFEWFDEIMDKMHRSGCIVRIRESILSARAARAFLPPSVIWMTSAIRTTYARPGFLPMY